MHQLVALVKAKLDATNGAFAALRGICLGNLPLPMDYYAVSTEPRRLEPWVSELRRVCEEADVKLHDGLQDLNCLNWLKQDVPQCFSCRRWKTTLDSAPVIPKQEN